MLCTVFVVVVDEKLRFTLNTHIYATNESVGKPTSGMHFFIGREDQLL